MILTEQMKDVIYEMSLITGVGTETILNDRRSRKELVVMCRALIADLFYRKFKLTLEKTGEIFKVDHSTVSNYLKIVKRNKNVTYDKYKFYYDGIERIWKKISSN